MKKLCLFIVLGFGGELFAQNSQDTVAINEVVISENRFDTAISQQNRNVYVLSRMEISKLPGRSLQEILQYCNGVDLRQRGPFGTQADLSIDGGSFEQAVVLLNGAKIIDPQTAHNMLNLPIPVEAIERIEVIRGPAARVYGINSLTGAINIVTRKPVGAGFVLDVHAGSNFKKDNEGSGQTFNARGVQAGLSLGGERQQHALFASYDKGNGYRFNTGVDNAKFLYLGNLQINTRNELSATLGYVNNAFGANSFYAAPGDRNSTEHVQTSMAILQSRHRISAAWTLMPRLSYRYNDDDYRYYGDAELNRGRSRHFSNSVSAELNASYKMNNAELGLGAELRREEINSTNIGRHHRENMGAYAQYRTWFFKDLNVNAGSYLNYNSDYGWQIYPGIDAGYKLSDLLKITGSVGTGQRLPSFTDLYLDQRPGNIGNPALDPESALQGELGMKFSNRHFNVSSAVFYRKIRKFVDWTRSASTQAWQSNNLGDQDTKGFNMRADAEIVLGGHTELRAGLAYTWIDADLARTDASLQSKYLLSSLKHQLTNTLNLQHKNFSAMFVSRLCERMSSKGYVINDLRLSQSFGYFSVYADGQNIFDARYFEIGSVPLPSRWFSLGLKFNAL